MFLSLLLSLTAAHAQDCDPKSLVKEIDTASPVALPAVFERWAACDAEGAKKNASKVFGRMLGSPEAYGASLKAIEVGASPTVRAWLAGLEPDKRSQAVVWLGERCGESEPVQSFFLAAHADKGLDFFVERWHRGLTDCRVPGVQKVLADAIADKEVAKDRIRLFSVLEVYARNLRSDAIPGLVEVAGNTTDAEGLTYIVNTFADAAGVGSVTGTDVQVARAAASALTQLGPSLPPMAVEQARTTLRSLGAEAASDQFATYRWPERKDGDGNYRYAVAVVEQVTCKNGKTQGNLHIGKFADPGSQWPEQVKEELLDKLKYEWHLDTAERCKGTAEIVVEMPAEPFVDDEARLSWLDAQQRAFSGRSGAFDRTRVVKHDPFVF